MTKHLEVLQSLSPDQKTEFEKDMAEMARMLTTQLQGKPDKVAEVNTNMRLQGEVYLNATIIFHRNEQGHFTAMVEKLHRFNNVDEYLDAINAARKPTDGFTKLK